MSRKNRDTGIPGYEYPKFDAKLDKSPFFKITKNRPKDSYLDDVMRQSKRLPGPAQYNPNTYEEKENSKKRSSLSRGKKITYLEALER
jgi:hypothetical protein